MKFSKILMCIAFTGITLLMVGMLSLLFCVITFMSSPIPLLLVFTGLVLLAISLLSLLFITFVLDGDLS